MFTFLLLFVVVVVVVVVQFQQLVCVARPLLSSDIKCSLWMAMNPLVQSSKNLLFRK